MRRLVPCSIALLAAALPAHAQQPVPLDQVPDLNSQLFRHSVDSMKTLWADDSGFISDDWTGNVRIATNYVDDPFVVYWNDGNDVAKLVDNAWQLDVLGAIHYDRFRLGINLPVYLLSSGDLSNAGTGLSDIGLSLRIAALDRADNPVGLAGGFKTGLPTSTVDTPLGGTFEWEIYGIVDSDVTDELLLTLNAAYRGVPDTELFNVVWGDQLAIRTGGGYSITEETTASAELGLATSVANWGATPQGPSEGAGFPIEAILGVTQQVASDWRVQAGVGKGLTPGIGSPAFRLIAAVEFRPPPDEDWDDDGISNADDACPREPEDFDGLLDEDGCIDLQSEVWITVVHPDGTPVPDAKLEVEGHTVTPDQPWTVDPGSYPVAVTAENTLPGNLVVDARSDAGVQKFEVVLTPTGTLKVTLRNADGEVYNDGEVVIDGKQILAGGQHELAIATGEHNVRGQGGEEWRPADAVAIIQKGESTRVELVLMPAKVTVTKERIEIEESIYFDTNKTTIQEVSFDLLDEVAGILVDHPEITKIRIEGHTDQRGDAAYNKKLSEGRAAAVLDYLAGKGVDKGRMESIGYGEEKPLDKRRTKAAYEKNRRVDFFVVERTD